MTIMKTTPTLRPHAATVTKAEELNANDPDWTYVAEKLERGELAKLAVYDEDDELLGYL